MKLAFLVPFVLTTIMHRAIAEPFPTEPGPEAAGLRLRLVVTPRPVDGKEGYDVQAALINVSHEAILLQLACSHEKGEFKEFLEASLSIESYPEIAPWDGQAISQKTTSSEYTLQSGKTLSLEWHTTGRHLKNSVSNPLEVQDPEFIESGLYAVHASVILNVGGRMVRLRSNEQLVPIGGSRASPRPTYGRLWQTDENEKTATLGLGSLDKVITGDRFLIQTMNIGMDWTLTITNVEPRYSTGTLVPSQVNPTPAFPQSGNFGTLVLKR
jgi:hypothetical protein